MNKTEKLISILLAGVLAWYIFSTMSKKGEESHAAAGTNVVAVAEQPAAEKTVQQPAAAVAEKAVAETKKVEPAKPSVPEQAVVLENDEVKLELSSWGAVVKKATLKQYARDCGEISEKNPAVVMDFSDGPLGALSGLEGLAANAAYEVASRTDGEVVFRNAVMERRIALDKGYRITFKDVLAKGGVESKNSLSVGSVQMGGSKNDLLSVDSWVLDKGNGKPGVIHHGDDDSPLKAYLVGGLSGGCSGSKSAAGMPQTATASYAGAQGWIALKNRFFVAALCSTTETIAGFDAEVDRDMLAATYRPERVAVKANFAKAPAERTSVFFVGPKKQSLLWDLGMKDVMEFGMWRWLCYPLVWVLNLFNGWIPNFGVAIILLTILVRLVFWPLTRKSTEGMKRMQELSPLMKEIQKKYKDNPQRLQQETWALYKEKKVNPMSSCLPMLIQIPVFIALFNVLRSAVELRYAPFLWIADLSEPEGLFASWFPFGGLNLLPILMAVSTGLQSAFTPSTGDKQQQRMMMVFMPIMMLVMFYSFPSALSLYWFLSNLFSIVQMWLIRRETAKKQEVLTPEVIDPPQPTRQMRRHG